MWGEASASVTATRLPFGFDRIVTGRVDLLGLVGGGAYLVEALNLVR